MKTTICAKELRQLKACREGYNTFYEAHGESVVKLSEALESNGIDDVFWLLKKVDLTRQQENDLHLLACTYAEAVLPIYEQDYPADDRPRKVIETNRLWVAGEASEWELRTAWEATRRAVREVKRGVAREAARAAAEAATLEAAWAAGASARAAAKAAKEAVQKEQQEQLRQVLLGWESA